MPRQNPDFTDRRVVSPDKISFAFARIQSRSYIEILHVAVDSALTHGNAHDCDAPRMSDSSQLPQFHVVGFSGHRQIAEPTKIAAAIRNVLAELKTEAPGEWIALSSIAAGCDTLFARAAIESRVAWQAVLPLAPGEFSKDFSAAEWREAE